MVLKDVLKIAIVYLGYADSINLDDSEINELNCPELKMLVRCANLVYSELLCEYLPIYRTKKVGFENGYCPYLKLEDQVIDIESVKTNGINITHKLDAKGIYANVPNAEIVYSYMPDFLTYESDIEIDAKVTKRIFALGVCSEFCLIHNLFEESLAFEKRYKDSLKEVLRKKGEIKIKARSWF